jgi:DNA-binding transcriptional ArsR family regulator
MQPAESYDPKALAAVLKALAHPVRLEILQLAAENGPMHAGQFNAVIAVSKQDLHRHLTVLKNEGLLVIQTSERAPAYGLAGPILAPLLTALALATTRRG